MRTGTCRTSRAIAPILRDGRDILCGHATASDGRPAFRATFRAGAQVVLAVVGRTFHSCLPRAAVLRHANHRPTKTHDARGPRPDHNGVSPCSRVMTALRKLARYPLAM